MKHQVEQNPQRPDLSFERIVGRSLEYLWSHVGWGAAVGVNEISGVRNHTEPKVNQLDLSFVNQNILGFDVSVRYSFIVQINERLKDAQKVSLCLVL